ncbi:MAG TPA: sigma-54 dependent transcriptional regulator [Steroidobacteraceae bacterium]|nr:sigma-54 dependent transcriptional regulator [Steroidobacteraceae bacterium]
MPEDLSNLNLIGASRAFRDALQLIQRVARSDATVLIQGETGTGKELAARAIHYLGARRNFPFIPVNCGALPDQLVENELFGHARGAYTDAREATAGLIADAEGGTLFLDEVEALSPRAQVAMLRFLQDGTFRPVGGRQQQQARVRIIAASNVNLSDLVRAGSFRADLLFRLRLMDVDLPPLRERVGDLALLSDHFLRKLGALYRDNKRLDAASFDALGRHDWPGNVRELENVLHREYLLSDDDVIRVRAYSFHSSSARRMTLPAEETPDALPEDTGEFEIADFGRAKAQAIGEFERAYLLDAMQRFGGNVSQAARSCGKERRAFGKLLKKYGIDRGRYGAGMPDNTR